MSTFFQQTAQAMIAKHIDRFPLLKLDQVIDWQPIEQYLNRQKTRYLRDHRGRPAYPLLSMFKAVLLGQWHSLSDPELEHSLITRIDFNLFCRFDELSIPDYSTLCRYRNWLAQDNTLSELLKLINRQLTEKGLKVEKASDAEGYIEKLHIFFFFFFFFFFFSPLLEGLPKGTTVYADKGYDSAENRQHLEEHQLQDGIMRKA
ncbi:transposase, partial [Neisseria meningitidis]|uniref:transposase n=1 Tax=Neisseria meningitidis TaxID=487 RepID=UPI000B05E5CB